MIAPSYVYRNSSIISGMETPGSVIQLRKGAETPMASTGQLYHVLQEQSMKLDSNALFGSTHTYALPTLGGLAQAHKTEFDVAIDADDLEGLDEESLKIRYQEKREVLRIT